MAKWEITDAAIGRIKERIQTMSAEEDNDWYARPWELLLKAMEPEDYARKRSTAEELIRDWIRKGEMTWICSSCFRAYARERADLREAGENILKGIRQMKEELE